MTSKKMADRQCTGIEYFLWCGLAAHGEAAGGEASGGGAAGGGAAGGGAAGGGAAGGGVANFLHHFSVTGPITSEVHRPVIKLAHPRSRVLISRPRALVL